MFETFSQGKYGISHPMEDLILLERPAAEAADEWTAFDVADEVVAIRSLMLHRLCTLSHRMRSAAVKEILSGYDLDLRDWMVVAALGDLSAGTQRDIVKTSGLDKVAVNRAAARLKERELVTSRPNRADGRSHVLELSARGRETLVDCSKALSAFEARVLSHFSREESLGMNRLFDRLMEAIERSV